MYPATRESPEQLLERLQPVARELRTFLQALPGLLADGHEGKHVVVKDDQLFSIWDTFDDGYQAGFEKFGWGVLFLVQPIDPRFLSFPWPKEILPRHGRNDWQEEAFTLAY